jgi:hypothetical protein
VRPYRSSRDAVDHRVAALRAELDALTHELRTTRRRRRVDLLRHKRSLEAELARYTSTPPFRETPRRWKTAVIVSLAAAIAACVAAGAHGPTPSERHPRSELDPNAVDGASP